MKKMKKTLLLSIFLITLFSTTQAQTYNEKKEMYDTHQYVKQLGDPYTPLVAGLASYFIPGLGQMICDESSRGLAFLGGYVGCLALSYYGMYEMVNETSERIYDGNYYSTPSTKGSGKMLLGICGAIGINIWSIVDAVHVAKVNNMYFQDHFKRTGSINFEIAPFAEPITMCNQVTIPVGLTLKATF
jgi:hypothetical protein